MSCWCQNSDFKAFKLSIYSCFVGFFVDENIFGSKNSKIAADAAYSIKVLEFMINPKN